MRGALTLDGARYLLVRTETLGVLAREAERLFGAAGAAAVFHAAGLVGGGKAAQAYAAEAGDVRALATRMAQRGTTLGWGRLVVEAAGTDGIVITAAHSPFAEAHVAAKAPVCHLLAGALAGLGRRAFGPAATAVEEACSAVGAGVCRFRIRA